MTRLRDGLVVAELALAVVLLAGAGLLVRSFLNLTGVEPGFRPEGAVHFEVELPSSAYASDAAIRSFHDRLVERLGGLPGAEAVGAVSRLPLAGRLNSSFEIIGERSAEPGQQRYIETRSATPGYFESIGIPLLHGRAISETDREGSVPVAVISQSTVQRHFAGTDPIGRQIRVSILEEPRTIVGVVGDVRHLGLDQQAVPHVYFPLAQVPRRAMNVVVRAAGDREVLASAIRNEIRELDPLLPPPPVRPLGDIVGESVARSRFVTTLLGVFAAVALVLAAIGIFGLLSYTVAQRTREFGIRLALGARSADVLGMVVRRALIMAGIGLGAGLAGALLLTRFVRSVLYGVSPADPMTLALVILVLVATVVLASLVPARRAAAVQPTEALRYE
jgi:putative ABC transport system permease protein